MSPVRKPLRGGQRGCSWMGRDRAGKVSHLDGGVRLPGFENLKIPHLSRNTLWGVAWIGLLSLLSERMLVETSFLSGPKANFGGRDWAPGVI